MTDYDKATGSAGTLRIRDTGSTVEFWILCSAGATQVGSMPWSGVVNGVPVSGAVALPAGFGSKLCASYTVTYSQTVQFNIPASGTSGLGGPTNHAAAIPRGPAATIPDAPHGYPDTAHALDQITTTSMRYSFRDGSDGGSSVTSRAVQYATSPDFSTGASAWLGVDSSGIYVATGLHPGVMYYFHARVQNAVGLSPASAVSSARTLGGIYVSDGTTWKPAEVYVSDGTTWKPAEVYVSDGTTWKPAG